MNNSLEKIFSWLKHRLAIVYKEQPDSKATQNLHKIYQINKDIFNCNIPSKDLDMIINKYYFDFFMDKDQNKDGFDVGFSDKEREILRHNIININKDISQYICQNQMTDKTIEQTQSTLLDNIFENEQINNIVGNII